MIAVRSGMSQGEDWGLAEPSRSTRTNADWFRSTDIGCVDADGFLDYADRAGDEIATAEAVIYPQRVEVELLRHTAVANCGVVGLDSEGIVEVVGAVVLKRPADASVALAGDILAGCAGEATSRPDRVVFFGELPLVGITGDRSSAVRRSTSPLVAVADRGRPPRVAG